MLRKSILALATCVTLGAAALSPTAASAHWGGGFGSGHGGWYHGPFVPVYAGPGYGGCMVQTWVPTPYGPVLRWVNRCN